ncbi:eukaryotic translation initiation factor 3 subunit A [Batrachochytrium dendrobatidis]
MKLSQSRSELLQENRTNSWYIMAPFYQKPENAIKRAEELVAVNQHSAALNLLHEVILSKRARSTSIQVLEPIVIKFIEFAVILGKGKVVREALYQYKNIVQNTTVVTIEHVIKRYLELAEEQLAQAQQKAEKINLDVVDDLEAFETPESILMSTVSTDDTKDRTDRAVVTPWLRFLWEAYRTSLDTLRNNARLEMLYQYVANQAFAFCLKYSRKTEFRRLCDILRQHLSSATKYQSHDHSIDLNDPETLQRHLDTRFVQLNAAAELEHWQEGFRSIEDIHHLLEVSKNAPKSYMMANYYEKLARIFMVGENYLFHSAALSKFYSIMRQNKNLPQEEHERLASLVLVSVLSIPIIVLSGSRTAEADESKQRTQRLMTLLRVTQLPTRESLLKEALGKNVFPLVRPEIKHLYKSLEVDFHPLSICKKIAPSIAYFSENAEFSRYAKLLHQVVLTRLLQQLSQVYSIIKIDHVVQLASLPAPYNFDAHAIERFVMNGCKRGELTIRVDHKTKTLSFDAGFFASTSESSSEGPRLHQIMLPGERVRLHLTCFAKRLHSVMGFVDPSITKQKTAFKIKSFQNAAAHLEEERSAVSVRRALVFKKKEMRDADAASKKQEALALRAQRLQQEQAAEKIRLEEEFKRREIERMEEVRRDIQRQEAQKLAEQLASELREKNVNFKEEDLSNMDTNKLVMLQISQLDKERRELMLKIKAVHRRIDHTERAMRLEEIPLLEKDYKKQDEMDRLAFDNGHAARLEAAKAKYACDKKQKTSVLRMMDDYTCYLSDLKSRQKEEFAVLQEQAAAKLKAAKAKRVKELRARHEADKIRRANEEAERIKREEEELLEAERAKQNAIKAEEEKAKAEEYRRKADEIANKQRERELEVEQKRLRVAEEPRRKPVEAFNSSWRPRPAAVEPSKSVESSDKYVSPAARAALSGASTARPFEQSGFNSSRPGPGSHASDNRSGAFAANTSSRPAFGNSSSAGPRRDPSGFTPPPTFSKNNDGLSVTERLAQRKAAANSRSKN